VNDVLEGYKQRRAEIGRAALENCALEQGDVNECFKNGAWAERLALCRAQNRKLERCYLMQSVCFVICDQARLHGLFAIGNQWAIGQHNS
jgi:hypothetical protein